MCGGVAFGDWARSGLDLAGKRRVSALWDC